MRASRLMEEGRAGNDAFRAADVKLGVTHPFCSEGISLMKRDVQNIDSTRTKRGGASIMLTKQTPHVLTRARHSLSPSLALSQLSRIPLLLTGSIPV